MFVSSFFSTKQRNKQTNIAREQKMEYYDEDRPTRFVVKSRPSSHTPHPEDEPKNPNKILISLSILISTLTLSLSFLYFESEPTQSLLLWLSLSLLLGPFAPSSLTAGQIRVGHGPIIQPPPQQIHKSINNDNNKRSNKIKNGNNNNNNNNNNSPSPVIKVDRIVKESVAKEEWSEEEINILKKQLIKHPAGKAGRWEVIAKAFGGKYETEKVIKKAKEVGEKKVYESDDYAQFLKNRKGSSGVVEENGEEGWSNGEDIALLSALKAFPKEVDMRWEKIRDAVPGKSKEDCMKRVAELKKGFRSSKVISGNLIEYDERKKSFVAA